MGWTDWSYGKRGFMVGLTLGIIFIIITSAALLFVGLTRPEQYTTSEAIFNVLFTIFLLGILFIPLMLLAGWSIGKLIGGIKKENSPEGIKKRKDLQGIGGWLILVLIGIILGILVNLFAIGVVFSLDSLEYSLKSVGGILLLVISLILGIVGLILMFMKKRFFVKFIIFTYWYTVLVGSIKLLQKIYGVYDFVIVLGGAIIWTLYFLRSIRVKNTFVN